MSRFTPIPAPPVFGTQEWEVRTLNAMKQNIDLLTGLRNETDLSSKALLTSTFNLPFSGDRLLDKVQNISYNIGSQGNYISDNTGGSNISNLVNSIDGGVLADDLDIIRQDIAMLRNTVNSILLLLR